LCRFSSPLHRDLQWLDAMEVETPLHYAAPFLDLPTGPNLWDQGSAKGVMVGERHHM